MASYWLKIPCPVCLDRNNVTPIKQWYHTKCGSRIYIDEGGYLHCESGCANYHIVDSKWGCPSHSSSTHELEYYAASSRSISRALAMAVQTLDDVASIQWIQAVIISIKSQ